jgi:hypothetical protein
MAIYNPLEWQNENGLSGYPFDEEFEVQNFIVDASFIQFDDIVPVLNYVIVNKDRITLNIAFDDGLSHDVVYLKSTYDQGEEYRSVRIYNQTKERYFGCLAFGPGTATLWSTYVGQKIVYGKSFLPQTVRGIPSKDAVYLFDGSYGDVELTRTLGDSTIFYNTSKPNLAHPNYPNTITFNAVGGHAVVNPETPKGLRKINLVPPLNNNINLAANDVVKITTLNAQSLSIDLVAGSVSPSFLLPTLAK